MPALRANLPYNPLPMTRTRRKTTGTRVAAKAPATAKVPASKPSGIKPGRNATINDIARLASVSKKTVSRVINQSPLVQEETRARIQAVIDKFGYVPDPQARGLAFRKSFLIGLIYDNPNAQYIVNMMEGVLDAVRNTEYEVVVHPCDRKKPDFVVGVRRVANRLGLSIPGDLAIVGFDDGPLPSRLLPSLTTIRLPIRELGRIAATKILHPEAAGGTHAMVTPLEPHLVIRDSCQPP